MPNEFRYWKLPLNKNVVPVMTTVTPAMAQEILSREAPSHLRNRNVSGTHVGKIARMIETGKWDPHVGMLHINKHGILLNGQHRMRAVVQSGKNVQVLVLYNCPDAVMVDVDQEALKRSFRHILAMRGVNNAALTSAVCSVLYMIENGGHILPSHTELDNLYVKFGTSVDFCILRFSGCRRYPAPVIGAFAYTYSKFPTLITELATQLVSTIGRTAGGSAVALDKAVDGTYNYSGSERSALMRKTLRAIQLHVEGKKVGKLQDSMEGLNWAKRLHGISTTKP
jgi:hypothetical protein